MAQRCNCHLLTSNKTTAEVLPPASKILGMAEVYDTEVTRVLPFPHTVPNFAGLAAAPAAGGSHKEKEKAGKEKEKEKERDKDKEKEKQPSYPTTTGTQQTGLLRPPLMLMLMVMVMVLNARVQSR